MMSDDVMSMVRDPSPTATVGFGHAAAGPGSSAFDAGDPAAIAGSLDNAVAPAFGKLLDAELAGDEDDEQVRAPDSRALGDDGAMAIAVALSNPMLPPTVTQAKLVASLDLSVARDSSILAAEPTPSRLFNGKTQSRCAELSPEVADALEPATDPEPSTGSPALAVKDAKSGATPAGAGAGVSSSTASAPSVARYAPSGAVVLATSSTSAVMSTSAMAKPRVDDSAPAASPSPSVSASSPPAAVSPRASRTSSVAPRASHPSTDAAPPEPSAIVPSASAPDDVVGPKPPAKTVLVSALGTSTDATEAAEGAAHRPVASAADVSVNRPVASTKDVSAVPALTSANDVPPDRPVASAAEVSPDRPVASANAELAADRAVTSAASASTESASNLDPRSRLPETSLAFMDVPVASASPRSLGVGEPRKAAKAGAVLSRSEPSRSVLEGAVQASMFVDTASPSDAARPLSAVGRSRVEPRAEGAVVSIEPSLARTPEVERAEDALVNNATAKQAEVVTVGGPSLLADGTLTSIVSRASVRSTNALPSALHEAPLGGVRERVRAAASEVADRRVLSRGIDAEIDLGDAGRIQVRAENPELRMDIKLDADVAHTARALAEHARDLSLELRTEARDARVTVTGPSTHTSVSSHGMSEGRSGGGESAPRREPGHQETPRERDGSVAVTSAKSGVGPRVSRRARFVL